MKGKRMGEKDYLGVWTQGVKSKFVRAQRWSETGGIGVLLETEMRRDLHECFGCEKASDPNRGISVIKGNNEN